MKIGNKILELRKKNNLSQEQLAEKMNVARQTISKWELGETSPDLEQAKILSQIFNVSLDDLTNNEIENILISKMNNTEKTTKVIINILKIILIIMLMYAIVLISKLFFEEYFTAEPVSTTMSFNCSLENKTYKYTIYQETQSPNILKLYTNDNDLKIDSSKYNDYEWLMDDINKNDISRGGKCFINQEE